jgi:hypothetical protein
VHETKIRLSEYKTTKVQMRSWNNSEQKYDMISNKNLGVASRDPEMQVYPAPLLSLVIQSSFSR